uniref:Uncharacterized protein n=1 Tax=Heterorhabditis bacteriophora TaxID=37862 RepID=A0A1I7WIT6_HETBA
MLNKILKQNKRQSLKQPNSPLFLYQPNTFDNTEPTYSKDYFILQMLLNSEFAADTEKELDLVIEKVLIVYKFLPALHYGAQRAVVSSHWAQGEAGAVVLAEALIEATSAPTNNFKYTISLLLYFIKLSILL